MFSGRTITISELVFPIRLPKYNLETESTKRKREEDEVDENSRSCNKGVHHEVDLLEVHQLEADGHHVDYMFLEVALCVLLFVTVGKFHSMQKLMRAGPVPLLQM
eukprot:gnl/MRDRNA2_/MRDRNA2_23823_c0_seq2.p1 gnl/MRDRNA2_/MRDRNA2_23823_c0~~gnl/MRDRNA2_/MRDRNA2_23823_c0_seq2.p1  ORF type:complete len:105 (-),score=23.23 gnl/MRDRNA2_/MRDRNA2_23823_c0_seq2:217-531(-)